MPVSQSEVERESVVELKAEREFSGQLRSEIHEMCQKTVEMLKLTWEGFRRQDIRPLEPAGKLGREIHQREKELTQRVAEKLTAVDSELCFLPMHFERVGDNIEFLVRAIKMMVQEGIPFSERAIKEINALFEKAIELVECMRDVVGTRNRVLIRHIVEEGEKYAQMADEFALFHQERLIQGLCVPKSSSVYLAILDYLKGIESHIRQMAEKLSSGSPS